MIARIAHFFKFERIIFFWVMGMIFPFIYMYFIGYESWMWLWEGLVLAATFILLFVRFNYIVGVRRQNTDPQIGSVFSISLEKADLYSTAGNLLESDYLRIKDVETILDKELIENSE